MPLRLRVPVQHACGAYPHACCPRCTNRILGNWRRQVGRLWMLGRGCTRSYLRLPSRRAVAHVCVRQPPDDRAIRTARVHLARGHLRDHLRSIRRDRDIPTACRLRRSPKTRAVRMYSIWQTLLAWIHILLPRLGRTRAPQSPSCLTDAETASLAAATVPRGTDIHAPPAAATSAKLDSRVPRAASRARISG